MGDTLLSDDDDEPNHRFFPVSSQPQFFMNSPGVKRDITLSFRIVLFVILENFTSISLIKKNTHLPSRSMHTHRVDWFSHE